MKSKPIIIPSPAIEPKYPDTFKKLKHCEVVERILTDLSLKRLTNRNYLCRKCFELQDIPKAIT